MNELTYSAAAPRLGLALSGGGYRAAAFHLGTLRKLHRMGHLPKVRVLSTISGGSIAGAAYCLRPEADVEEFCQRMAAALLRDDVLGQVLRSAMFIRLALVVGLPLVLALGLLFTSWAPAAVLVLALLVWVLLRYQFAWFPISQEVEKAYDKFFYHGQTLPDLPPEPELAMGSSNLQTARPFTFSRDWMNDSTYEFYKEPVDFTTAGFPVARAVTASSCVPFAFSPVAIAPPFFCDPARARAAHAVPRLVDGGVYDNQGVQKLTQDGSRFACGLVIASDAGGGWPSLEVYHNTITLLLRTVDLFMYRIRNVQMADNLYQHVAGRGRPMAYCCLSWRLANCIPGFVNNMIQGNVLTEVLDARRIPPLWRDHPRQYSADITEHLQQEVNYPLIASNDLSDDEWHLACNVGTTLSPLTPTQVKLLMRQAENMTELQVRLYMPWPNQPPEPPLAAAR